MKSLLANVFVIQRLVLINPHNYACKQFTLVITNTTSWSAPDSQARSNAQAGLAARPSLGSCRPVPMSKLLRQHLLLQRDLQEDLFSHIKGLFFFIPSPLSQTKVHFHPTSQPWKTCSTTCCRFSLSNTCHNTWLDSFLPPSHFLSSHLCRLCSKHNFWLKSSSTGHFKCYQQGQTSPSSSSLHLTPKDQLMKCKTSGLFD